MVMASPVMVAVLWGPHHGHHRRWLLRARLTKDTVGSRITEESGVPCAVVGRHRCGGSTAGGSTVHTSVGKLGKLHGKRMGLRNE
jgi:hypothetical protein